MLHLLPTPAHHRAVAQGGIILSTQMSKISKLTKPSNNKVAVKQQLVIQENKQRDTIVTSIFHTELASSPLIFDQHLFLNSEFSLERPELPYQVYLAHKA